MKRMYYPGDVAFLSNGPNFLLCALRCYGIEDWARQSVMFVNDKCVTARRDVFPTNHLARIE